MFTHGSIRNVIHVQLIIIKRVPSKKQLEFPGNGNCVGTFTDIMQSMLLCVYSKFLVHNKYIFLDVAISCSDLLMDKPTIYTSD